MFYIKHEFIYTKYLIIFGEYKLLDKQSGLEKTLLFWTPVHWVAIDIRLEKDMFFLHINDKIYIRVCTWLWCVSEDKISFSMIKL